VPRGLSNLPSAMLFSIKSGLRKDAVNFYDPIDSLF
jgi:hypothetical protein